MTSVLVSLGLVGLGLGFVIGSPLNYMMLERTKTAEASSALASLSLVRSIGTTVAPAIMIGFIAHAGLGRQSALLAQLPTTITAPPLPYAQVLTEGITKWKADPDIGPKLSGVTLPDLSQTTIDVSAMKGSGTLPDDLVELLETADVTNITERTKTVAQRMFELNTPSTVATIQDGVDKGVDGLTTGMADVDKGLADMTSGLSDMDAKLAEMDKNLAEMTTAIAGMKDGISQMGAALAGIDKGIAGMKSAVYGINQGLAGMDSGLVQQKAALAQLEAVPSPNPPSDPPPSRSTSAGSLRGAATKPPCVSKGRPACDLRIRTPIGFVVVLKGVPGERDGSIGVVVVLAGDPGLRRTTSPIEPDVLGMTLAQSDHKPERTAPGLPVHAFVGPDPQTS